MRGQAVKQIRDLGDESARRFAIAAGIAGGLDMRYTNAADAGAALAVDVYRYLQDPEGIGRDVLREAYGTFMGQHAGNFTDSAREATRAADLACT